METPALELTDEIAIARAFRAAVDQMPRPLFAVLDGGQFDDLEDELADAGIPARSLFLEGGNEDIRRDGPWLVTLRDKATRNHIEELALERPCAVFWSCPKGEQTLWRHLRTINEILVPDDRIQENDGKSGNPVKYERVLFRHWDPNVLGSILPLLDTDQSARLLGGANTILINATQYGGLKRIAHQEPSLVPSAEPLIIRPDQIVALKDARIRSSAIRAARFLKRTSSPAIVRLPERELAAIAEKRMRMASSLGIAEERAQIRFCWLMANSDDRFIDQPGVRDLISRGKGTPSSRLNLLADAMAEAAAPKRAAK
jgi:hypothetical protein